MKLPSTYQFAPNACRLIFVSSTSSNRRLHRFTHHRPVNSRNTGYGKAGREPGRETRNTACFGLRQVRQGKPGKAGCCVVRSV